MNWYFRPLIVGEKTREPIQGEFFATEAIRNPTEALVREGTQNTLDAGKGKAVHVRLFLGTGVHALPANRASEWLGDAWKHIEAESNGLREPPSQKEPCPFLVFEDFGTKGLQGNVEQAFDEPDSQNHFFYFFRAEGRTGKNDLDRGRWGIGKHVFPRSSRVSTFFGLTVRADDGKRLLMGHTVLKSHRVGSTPFSPDGYLGEQHPDNLLILPISEDATLNKFCNDFRLDRRNESGLSIVVPYVDRDFTINHLKEAVVVGYFYPILTGSLVVTVETATEKVEINAESIIDVARGLDGDAGKELLPVIDLAKWAAFRPNHGFIELKPCNLEKPEWADDLIPSEHLKPMLEKLKNGERLAVRVNLNVREKGKEARPSHFDVFLRQDGFDSGRPLFIREGIIISDVRGTRARGIRSLVVIEDKPIASLLGDSENPAHTQWQRDSSNFKGKYCYGSDHLDFVTRIVARLVQALTAQEQEEDWDFLLDIFSLPEKSEDEPEKPEQKKKKVEGKEIDDIDVEQEPRKKRFQVKQVPGGFTVIRGVTGTKPPARLDIRVAYDLRRGNPLRKYHPADFRLNQSPILFDPPPAGLKIVSKEENRVIVDILDPDFKLAVTGFDVKRDLFVNVKMQEDGDDK